jgi:hypothetical protein
MKTVRELSLAAPCNVLGIFVKETAHRITYRLRDGREAFARRSCRLHVEPCPSCSDHDCSLYPLGYWEWEGELDQKAIS